MAYAGSAYLRPRAREYAFLFRRQETAAMKCQPSGGRAVWVRPEPERDSRGAKHWSRSDSAIALLPLDPRSRAAAKGAGPQTDRPERHRPEDSAIKANATVHVWRGTSAARTADIGRPPILRDTFPSKTHPVWFRLVRVGENDRCYRLWPQSCRTTRDVVH